MLDFSPFFSLDSKTCGCAASDGEVGWPEVRDHPQRRAEQGKVEKWSHNPMDIEDFWIKLYLKPILTKSINYHFHMDH